MVHDEDGTADVLTQDAQLDLCATHEERDLLKMLLRQERVKRDQLKDQLRVRDKKWMPQNNYMSDLQSIVHISSYAQLLNDVPDILKKRFSGIHAVKLILRPLQTDNQLLALNSTTGVLEVYDVTNGIVGEVVSRNLQAFSIAYSYADCCEIGLATCDLECSRSDQKLLVFPIKDKNTKVNANYLPGRANIVVGVIEAIVETNNNQLTSVHAMYYLEVVIALVVLKLQDFRGFQRDCQSLTDQSALFSSLIKELLHCTSKYSFLQVAESKLFGVFNAEVAPQQLSLAFIQNWGVDTRKVHILNERLVESSVSSANKHAISAKGPKIWKFSEEPPSWSIVFPILNTENNCIGILELFSITKSFEHAQNLRELGNCVCHALAVAMFHYKCNEHQENGIKESSKNVREIAEWLQHANLHARNKESVQLKYEVFRKACRKFELFARKAYRVEYAALHHSALKSQTPGKDAHSSLGWSSATYEELASFLPANKEVLWTNENEQISKPMSNFIGRYFSSKIPASVAIFPFYASKNDASTDNTKQNRDHNDGFLVLASFNKVVHFDYSLRILVFHSVREIRDVLNASVAKDCCGLTYTTSTKDENEITQSTNDLWQACFSPEHSFLTTIWKIMKYLEFEYSFERVTLFVCAARIQNHNTDIWAILGLSDTSSSHSNDFTTISVEREFQGLPGVAIDTKTIVECNEVQCRPEYCSLVDMKIGMSTMQSICFPIYGPSMPEGNCVMGCVEFANSSLSKALTVKQDTLLDEKLLFIGTWLRNHIVAFDAFTVQVFHREIIPDDSNHRTPSAAYTNEKLGCLAEFLSLLDNCTSVLHILLHCRGNMGMVLDNALNCTLLVLDACDTWHGIDQSDNIITFQDQVLASKLLTMNQTTQCSTQDANALNLHARNGTTTENDIMTAMVSRVCSTGTSTHRLLGGVEILTSSSVDLTSFDKQVVQMMAMGIGRKLESMILNVSLLGQLHKMKTSCAELKSQSFVDSTEVYARKLSESKSSFLLHCFMISTTCSNEQDFVMRINGVFPRTPKFSSSASQFWVYLGAENSFWTMGTNGSRLFCNADNGIFSKLCEKSTIILEVIGDPTSPGYTVAIPHFCPRKKALIGATLLHISADSNEMAIFNAQRSYIVDHIFSDIQYVLSAICTETFSKIDTANKMDQHASLMATLRATSIKSELKLKRLLAVYNLVSTKLDVNSTLDSCISKLNDSLITLFGNDFKLHFSLAIEDWHGLKLERSAFKHKNVTDGAGTDSRAVSIPIYFNKEFSEVAVNEAAYDEPQKLGTIILCLNKQTESGVNIIRDIVREVNCYAIAIGFFFQTYLERTKLQCQIRDQEYYAKKNESMIAVFKREIEKQSSAIDNNFVISELIQKVINADQLRHGIFSAVATCLRQHFCAQEVLLLVVEGDILWHLPVSRTGGKVKPGTKRQVLRPNNGLIGTRISQDVLFDEVVVEWKDAPSFYDAVYDGFILDNIGLFDITNGLGDRVGMLCIKDVNPKMSATELRNVLKEKSNCLLPVLAIYCKILSNEVEALRRIEAMAGAVDQSNNINRKKKENMSIIINDLDSCKLNIGVVAKLIRKLTNSQPGLDTMLHILQDGMQELSGVRIAKCFKGFDKDVKHLERIGVANSDRGAALGQDEALLFSELSKLLSGSQRLEVFTNCAAYKTLLVRVFPQLKNDLSIKNDKIFFRAIFEPSSSIPIGASIVVYHEDINTHNVFSNMLQIIFDTSFVLLGELNTLGRSNNNSKELQLAIQTNIGTELKLKQLQEAKFTLCSLYQAHWNCKTKNSLRFVVHQQLVQYFRVKSVYFFTTTACNTLEALTYFSSSDSADSKVVSIPNDKGTIGQVFQSGNYRATKKQYFDDLLNITIFNALMIPIFGGGKNSLGVLALLNMDGDGFSSMNISDAIEYCTMLGAAWENLSTATSSEARDLERKNLLASLQDSNTKVADYLAENLQNKNYINKLDTKLKIHDELYNALLDTLSSNSIADMLEKLSMSIHRICTSMYLSKAYMVVHGRALLNLANREVLSSSVSICNDTLLVNRAITTHLASDQALSKYNPSVDGGYQDIDPSYMNSPTSVLWVTPMQSNSADIVPEFVFSILADEKSLQSSKSFIVQLLKACIPAFMRIENQDSQLSKVVASQEACIKLNSSIAELQDSLRSNAVSVLQFTQLCNIQLDQLVVPKTLTFGSVCRTICDAMVFKENTAIRQTTTLFVFDNGLLRKYSCSTHGEFLASSMPINAVESSLPVLWRLYSNACSKKGVIMEKSSHFVSNHETYLHLGEVKECATILHVCTDIKMTVSTPFLDALSVFVGKLLASVDFGVQRSHEFKSVSMELDSCSILGAEIDLESIVQELASYEMVSIECLRRFVNNNLKYHLSASSTEVHFLEYSILEKKLLRFWPRDIVQSDDLEMKIEVYHNSGALSAIGIGKGDSYDYEANVAFISFWCSGFSADDISVVGIIEVGYKIASTAMPLRTGAGASISSCLSAALFGKELFQNLNNTRKATQTFANCNKQREIVHRLQLEVLRCGTCQEISNLMLQHIAILFPGYCCSIEIRGTHVGFLPEKLVQDKNTVTIDILNDQENFGKIVIGSLQFKKHSPADTALLEEYTSFVAISIRNSLAALSYTNSMRMADSKIEKLSTTLTNVLAQVQSKEKAIKAHLRQIKKLKSHQNKTLHAIVENPTCQAQTPHSICHDTDFISALTKEESVLPKEFPEHPVSVQSERESDMGIHLPQGPFMDSIVSDTVNDTSSIENVHIACPKENEEDEVTNVNRIDLEENYCYRVSPQILPEMQARTIMKNEIRSIPNCTQPDIITSSVNPKAELKCTTYTTCALKNTIDPKTQRCSSMKPCTSGSQVLKNELSLPSPGLQTGAKPCDEGYATPNYIDTRKYSKGHKNPQQLGPRSDSKFVDSDSRVNKNEEILRQLTILEEIEKTNCIYTG